MKKILWVLALFAGFTPAVFASPQIEDYEASLTAFTKVSGLYRDWAKPSPAYDVTLRRDPMNSLVDPQGFVIHGAGLHDGLAVQGIIWSGKERSALIEDEFYSEGDQVGPYRILKIEPNGFWAQKAGQKVFVALYDEKQVGAVIASPAPQVRSR